MKLSYIVSGAVFALVGSACLEMDILSGATYWFMSALGVWMGGIADAIRENGRAE